MGNDDKSSESVHPVDQLERQRRRLAFDLHDGPAQTLSAALLQLEIVEHRVRGAESLGPEIATLRELLEATADEIREMAQELRPSSLDADGLVAKLAGYVGDLTRRPGPLVSFSVEGDARPLSSSAQIAVFRIAQEAMNNARKHASASRVTVGLRFDPSEIVCSVGDDGRGFDPHIAECEDCTGLHGMRERAALLGGDLAISSAPGAGTEVTVRIPAWR